MTLATILAAMHLRPLLGKWRRTQDEYDPEKVTALDNSDDPAEDVVNEGEDEEQEEEDVQQVDDIEEADAEAGQHAAQSQSRRMKRFTTFTSGSTFTTFTRSSRSSTRSWLAKVRSFLLPRDPKPEEIEQYVPTYRSSPIIAGVLIPFSILLEVPGLTEHWYIMTESNNIVDSRPNPALLNAGMGISIACAVFANICLIMRFAERWVKPTTLLCILFLTVHGA